MGISISLVRLSVAFNDIARLTVVSRPKLESLETRPAVEMVTRRLENPSPKSEFVRILMALTTL